MAYGMAQRGQVLSRATWCLPARRCLAVLFSAVLALGAGGGTASALTITPTFDSTWSTAPTGVLRQAGQAFTYVDNLYAAAFANPINVNVDVSWGYVGGASLPGNALGATSISYHTSSLNGIESLLTSNATANPGNTALATAVHYLPASIAGSWTYIIPDAQYEALTGTNLSGFQAYIGFGSSTNWQFSDAGGTAAGAYDFISTAEHEMAHALGRVSYEFVDPAPPYLTPMDLYRYNCRSSTLNQTYDSTACFSINGGTTDLQTFSNTSDSADWYGPSGQGTDAYDAFLASGVTAGVTPVDYTLMNALGYDPVPEPGTAMILGVALLALSGVRYRIRLRRC